jgi:hypothetical protein
MEHMGIEFAVRARLGRNNWALTILHKNRGPVTLDFIGTRDQAIAAAHQSIDRWLHANPSVEGVAPTLGLKGLGGKGRGRAHRDEQEI